MRKENDEGDVGKCSWSLGSRGILGSAQLGDGEKEQGEGREEKRRDEMKEMWF